MICDGCNYYFLRWAVFALLPSNSPKNQNFQKMKKIPGDIIILHYICMVTEIWCAADGWIDGRTDKKGTYGSDCSHLKSVTERKNLTFEI